MMCKVITEVF